METLDVRAFSTMAETSRSIFSSVESCAGWKQTPRPTSSSSDFMAF